MMNPRDRFKKSQKHQRDDFERLIAREFGERPGSSYREIGARFGLTAGRVAQIAVKFKVRRRPRLPRLVVPTIVERHSPADLSRPLVQTP